MLKKIFLLSFLLLCNAVLLAKHPLLRGQSSDNRQSLQSSGRDQEQPVHQTDLRNKQLDRSDGLAVFDSFIEAISNKDTTKIWKFFSPELRLDYITAYRTEKNAQEALARQLEKSDLPKLAADFDDEDKKQSIRNEVAEAFLPAKLNGQWYIVINLPDAAYYPQVDQSSKKAVIEEFIRVMIDHDILRYWVLLQPKTKKSMIERHKNEAQAIIAMEKNYSAMLKLQAEAIDEIPMFAEAAGISPEEAFVRLIRIFHYAHNDNPAMAWSLLPAQLQQQLSGNSNAEEAKNNMLSK